MEGLNCEVSPEHQHFMHDTEHINYFLLHNQGYTIYIILLHHMFMIILFNLHVCPDKIGLWQNKYKHVLTLTV